MQLHRDPANDGVGGARGLEHGNHRTQRLLLGVHQAAGRWSHSKGGPVRRFGPAVPEFPWWSDRSSPKHSRHAPGIREHKAMRVLAPGASTLDTFASVQRLGHRVCRLLMRGSPSLRSPTPLLSTAGPVRAGPGARTFARASHRALHAPLARAFGAREKRRGLPFADPGQIRGQIDVSY